MQPRRLVNTCKLENWIQQLTLNQFPRVVFIELTDTTYR